MSGKWLIEPVTVYRILDEGGDFICDCDDRDNAREIVAAHNANGLPTSSTRALD